MEIIRTTRLKLDLPLDVANRTVQEWTNVCNYVSQVSFEKKIANPIKLHKTVYNDVRGKFSLSAQVTASTFRIVTSKYAAAKTKKINLEKPVNFKPNSVMLQGGIRGRDFSFTKNGLSVWTIEGRIKNISFHGEPKLVEYLSRWKLGDARLYIRKNKVYLSVSFKQEVKPITKPDNFVVGVDRGTNFLAVATDGKHQKFFGSGHTKTVRSHYAKTRSKLQRKLAEAKKAHKDTHSISRVLKRQSGKSARFMRDTNHIISKAIIDFACETGNPTIAIEQLEGIRGRSSKMRKEQRKEINQWAFYQLAGFIRYKADAHGFAIVDINPAYTSQGCSVCGYTNRLNRYRHTFTCHACGYQLHSDLNASRNIRLRGILARQALCENGLPSISPEALPCREGKPSPLSDGN